MVFNFETFLLFPYKYIGSIVPYLWGEKLGLYVKSLESILIPNELEPSYGKIEM
jgi:hypothetical protein